MIDKRMSIMANKLYWVVIPNQRKRNFRHIVRLKTRDVVRMVTTLKGYKPIDILAPAELI